MKKFNLFLVLGTLSVLGCTVDSTPQDTRSEREKNFDLNIQEAEKDRADILATTDIMERVQKIKNMYGFMPSYDQNSNSFYIDDDKWYSARRAYLKVFMQPGELKDNLDCFTYGDNYNSDECILARRRIKPNKLNDFDYSALLPEGHKINSIEKFEDLLGAYYYYYDSWDYIDENGKWQHKPTKGQRYYDNRYYTYHYDGYRCSNDYQQLTSYEIENCKTNIRQYITGKVMGTLKLCKDVAPEAYKGLFTVTDEDIQAEKMSTAIISKLGLATKSDAEFTAAMVEDFAKKDAPEFGYRHRCRMENWEKDYKNWLSKVQKAATKSKKTGKVITLN